MFKLDKYFIGKTCTIFTVQMNRFFKDETFHNYFTGTLEFANEYGIMLNQLNNCKTFIMGSHIAAIAEEVVLNPDNPDDAKTIEKITTCLSNPPVAKKESEKSPAPETTGMLSNNKKINLDELMAIAENFNKGNNKK